MFAYKKRKLIEQNIRYTRGHPHRIHIPIIKKSSTMSAPFYKTLIVVNNFFNFYQNQIKLKSTPKIISRNIDAHFSHINEDLFHSKLIKSYYTI